MRSFRRPVSLSVMESRSVGIVGVGLVGGSIALAALRIGYRVSLYDSVASGELSGPKFRGASIAANLAELVSNSRLIVLATPIDAVKEVGNLLSSLVSSSHVVSDVASAKRPVVAVLADLLRDHCDYVPAHPMAGSEKSGAQAAREDLFVGAVTLICPELARDAASVRLVSEFWQNLGTRIVSIGIPEHDTMVALISHLPHLLAALLVKQVADTDRSAFELCGSGFRDATRIASASPRLWKDILLSNSDAVCHQIRLFKRTLEEAEKVLADKDAKNLQALLDEAKENRDRLSA
jgi:prephenate dehydrogenase